MAKQYARLIRAGRICGAIMAVLCVAVGCASPEKHRVGETFDIGTVSYTVKSKELRTQIKIDETKMGSGPGASFVIINYSITNRGTNPVIVSPLFLRLLSPGRGEFDIDLPATHAFGAQKEDGSPFLPSTSDLAAGASGAYSAVLRVPDGVAHGSFAIAIRRRAIVTFQ